jgi:hypothetical protein
MRNQPIETNPSSQHIASEERARADLWGSAARLARTEQEHIVLVDNFVYGLPPRVILARHPNLFADIRAVYAAKRSLLVRLQRDCVLQQELLPV